MKAELGRLHENLRIQENVIILKLCPQYENAQISSKGQCMWFVIPTATRIERESVCVCVCVCVCVQMQEGAKHSDAIHVGPAWLQWHSCEFIMDINLRWKEADM
jgi:hypothetical protein